MSRREAIEILQRWLDSNRSEMITEECEALERLVEDAADEIREERGLTMRVDTREHLRRFGAMFDRVLDECDRDDVGAIQAAKIGRDLMSAAAEADSENTIRLAGEVLEGKRDAV